MHVKLGRRGSGPPSLPMGPQGEGGESGAAWLCSDLGGCFGSSAAQQSEGCSVPRKCPWELTAPFCARREGEAPALSLPPPPARPPGSLSSGLATAETLSGAWASSSSGGFLEPGLRGRTLAGGILFPLIKMELN